MTGRANSITVTGGSGPHAGNRVLAAGTALHEAKAAMIMVHGRGADAESILMLAEEIATPGFAYLAPQAAGNAWYPNSFMMPIPSNEPWLSSALSALESVVDGVVAAGLPTEKIALLGFSQGACLTLEFAARHAKRYGGLVGLSGALIGPDGTLRDYAGSLDGTPVFLGCSDVDFHIPEERVLQAEETLRHLGGRITTRIYPNMGHTVNRDEIAFVREMLAGLVA